VLKVQEAERGRISRELHDGVGQSLTALRIQLELLEHDLSPGPLRARVSDLRGLAEQSLQDVRQMSHLLRPQMLDELGLMPTLRWLARTFGQRTGLAVELSAEGIGDRLDPELDSLVFRVVQEALTNVAKHARVPSVRVRLAVRGNRLHLSVQDDGQGFEPDSESPAEGFGLRGMRDRVQLFGGRFTLRSRPGQGTTLEAEVPLGRPEAGP
jgi:two-component system sensor histidine kinase UhpB